ncbi:hypothetical protein SDC9_97288 [bioreactor metagenome]
MLIEEKINNLILSLENASSVTAEYINSRIEALHQEKQDIMKSFTHIPQKQNEIANFSDFDWENLSIEEKNKVARSFIEKVILTKNNVEIVFK